VASLKQEAAPPEEHASFLHDTRGQLPTVFFFSLWVGEILRGWQKSPRKYVPSLFGASRKMALWGFCHPSLGLLVYIHRTVLTNAKTVNDVR
jgi:hypothetical protein